MAQTTSQQQEAQQVQVQTPPEAAVSPEKSPAEVQYTQEQYSKMQSSLRTETQHIKDERDALALEKEIAKSEIDEAKAELAVLRSEIDAPYSDDGEKTAAQKLREAQIAIAKERVQFAKERADFLKEKTKENEAQRTTLLKRLAENYGVEVDALQKYEDPLEMLHYLANTEPKALASSLKEDSSAARLPRPTDTIGGGGHSFKKIEQAYGDGKVSTAEYLAAMKEHGKI